MNLEKMINDKKLLCAFIASAYSSGWCGKSLGKERDILKKKYTDFIAGKIPFPEEEIQKYRPDLYNLLIKNELRDYIYLGHLDMIKGRILNEIGVDISIVKNHQLSNGIIYECFPQFCRIVKKEGNDIYVKKEFIDGQQKIGIFEGSEIPNIGDLISIHWSYLLERIQTTSYFKELMRERQEKLKQYGL